MTTPNFGMTFSRPGDEPSPALGADFSKSLLIEVSDDASNAEFPVGEPKRFSSSDRDAVAALGSGPLAAAVRGINDQLTGLNSGADITVIRVAHNESPAAVATAIAATLGDVGYIASAVGATPRLIWGGRTSLAMVDGEGDPVVNAVVAALPAACDKLLAVSVVDVDDTDTAKAITAREAMNSERLMPVGVAARVWEGESVVTRAMGPRVLGLFNRVDNETGGPFDPIGNRPIYGLAGLSRKIPFSLLDGSTEGQQLLESEISIVAQGESGVDGSVADGGHVFVGFDNTTTGELWKQIHQVRGADYLTVKMMEITRGFLGRKITGDLVDAWLSSLRFMLRDHKAADQILGYDLQFTRDRNSPEQIRLGRLLVNLAIEPAPAFKLAQHEVRRYRPAVEGLVKDIIARLNTAA